MKDQRGRFLNDFVRDVLSCHQVLCEVDFTKSFLGFETYEEEICCAGNLVLVVRFPQRPFKVDLMALQFG